MGESDWVCFGLQIFGGLSRKAEMYVRNLQHYKKTARVKSCLDLKDMHEFYIYACNCKQCLKSS